MKKLLLLVLVACSTGPNPGPGWTNGNNGTNGTDGQNGAQGPQGSIGPQGPAGPAGTSDTTATSGSRLLAMYQTQSNADGSSSKNSYGQWFDSTLNVGCLSNYVMSDGKYHCIPYDFDGTGSVLWGSIAYTDSGCTNPVAVQSSCQSFTPIYATAYSQNTGACSTSFTTVYQVGTNTTVTTVYAGGPVSCYQVSANGTYYHVTKMDPSQFVETTLTFTH